MVEARQWRGVGNAAIIKVVVMGLTGVLGLITSRIILQNFGIAAYAQYGLIASLPALLPFADLGLAAVVINAVAEAKDPRKDAVMRRSITSALRVLIVSGAIIVVVAIVVTLLGLWPAILGQGLMPGGGWIAGLCLAIFGAGLPLTIGPRILVGLGRNTTQIATQSVVAPFILLCVGGGVLLMVPIGQYLAVFTYLASVLVSTLCLFLAAKAIAPQLGQVWRDLPRVKTVRGSRVMNMAGPMLIQMLALPIAMQTGRILVSHLGGTLALAEYNLGNQLFSIAVQTISAAGIALWPIFARARAAGRIESPMPATLWFVLGGLVLGGGMAILSPWLAALASGGRLTLDTALVVSFVVFVALQAAKYPIGMYMTDLGGLRFQVIPTILMVPISLGLAVWLIPEMGGAGAVVGVSVAVFLCQVIPNLLYVRWDISKRRRLAPAD